MINEEICKLRDELNKQIEQNADYEIIYNLSIALDELIVKYYKDEGTNKDSKKDQKFFAIKW